MRRYLLLIAFIVCGAANIVAADVELTKVADLTTQYFIMAYNEGGKYFSPYWTRENNQNVMSPGESAIICNGPDYYYLLKAEAITYKSEKVYRVSISNGLHELFPRGIGGAAYMNSAGWCFFAGECEQSGKSHVYGQDADGLGLWRITYKANKGFQFQCVGNDKYISYTMSNSSSADKYYWQCFAEGSLCDAEEALKLTPAYATFTNIYKMLEAWAADKTNITCEDATRSALSDALAQAQAAVDAARTMGELQSVIATLRSAATTFLNAAVVNKGCRIDMTAMIQNPSFETGNLDGWVAGSPSQGGDVGVKKSEEQYETTGTDGLYLFNTWSISDSYVYGNQEQYVRQSLTGLQPGEYRLTALASSNTYQSVNAPVELFGNNFVNSFVPQSKSTFKQTYEVSVFLMPSDKNLTIGMRSIGWFRADDFHLFYYGESEAYEETRRMATVKLYEEIAKQATDRSSYDAVLNEVRTALLAEGITDKEIAQQNALLREALMNLVKTGTTATGQFDLTALLNDRGVLRANNVSALTTLAQTLNNMPPGHYTLRAQAFYRPAAIAEALEMYEAGTEDHPATIYISRSQAPVYNIFDDARHAPSNSMEILATVDGRGAPTSDQTAMEAFSYGDYPAVVEHDLDINSNLSLGFRIKAPKASDNLFMANGMQLLYGPTPDVTISRAIPANQLTPLCVPFELTSDETRQLYYVGSVLNGQATIFPVATIHAGEPCVIQSTENITEFIMPATKVVDKKADTTPLPWDGGCITSDLKNYTWKVTSVDGKKVTKAENLTFVVADPMNMDFCVNLENLQVRRFLELEDYNATTSSHITNYNVAPPARRDQPNNVGVPVTVQNNAKLKVILSQDEEFSQKTTITTRLTDGKLVYIPNLTPHETYYYEVQSGNTTVAKGRFHTQGRLRMIYAPSIDNVRDLGGWKTSNGKYIRYGRIYRGGELNGSHTATAGAVKRLRALGVTSEIDLRIDYEQSSGKSAFGFSAEAGNFFFANAMDCEPENLSTAECYTRWKAEFDLIMSTLRKGGAIFFHCRIGADRTGLLSLMLEGLLGVARDQSNKNYELTSLSPSGVRTRDTQDAFFNYFNGLKGTNLQKKFNTFFLEKLKVSQQDIDEFRSIMLTSDPADGIVTPHSSLPSDDAIYDLSGRRILTPHSSLFTPQSSILNHQLPPGVYLRKGRKILIK